MTVSRARNLSSRPNPRVASINNPGTQATSNHDTRRVNMASNQHEVSVRSRNQYSVVGDSGEVIQIEASGACRRRARALVCRNPARLGATGAANESRFGTGISARILRAGLHHAARASRGNHTFGAEHRQTGEFDDASLVRAVSDGTGLRPGGSHRAREPHPPHRLLPQQSGLSHRPGAGPS
ncbi:Uncharacterised protein [Mycobacterium tuberculosis]|nr:Uncharacterised protein [Mycobacterium tuberculosis]CKR44899.1 Uncharacterised protein [Mycobacterium tuberculosis]CKS82433.1 Uncharacterised protein [Mycobacterium tuberculosis]CKT09857.1 Uncharacterised protein [Mycobacterium tuberculosis]